MSEPIEPIVPKFTAEVDINGLVLLVADQAARLGAARALARQGNGRMGADTLKQEVARLRALLEEIERIGEGDERA